MLKRNRVSNVNYLLHFVIASFIILFILLSTYFPLISSQKSNGEVIAAQTYYFSDSYSKSIEIDKKASNLQNEIKQWKLELIRYRANKDFAQIAPMTEKIAKVYYLLGDNRKAIEYWQQATVAYNRINDFAGVGDSLIGKAQVYRSNGELDKAINIAEKALEMARSRKNLNLEIAALGSRGEALHLEGKYQMAIADFKSGLNLVSSINNSYYNICLLNSLSRVYISLAIVNYRRVKSAFDLGDKKEIEKWKIKAKDCDNLAFKALKKSYDIASKNNNQQLQLTSLIYSIPPAIRTQRKDLTDIFQTAIGLNNSLPDSHFKAYTLIKLAQLISFSPIDIDFSITSCPQDSNYQQIESPTKLLNKAILIAKFIKSQDILALAYGNLGHIYECSQQYQQALAFTRKSQTVAKKKSNIYSNLYLWMWQEGRIFKAINQLEKSITAYKKSINLLEDISQNIVINNQDLQFEIHKSIEPIYRQFIEIKLQIIETSKSQRINSHMLGQIMTNLEKIKLIEMQNYFANQIKLNNLSSAKKSINHQYEKTAILYTLILDNHFAVIASFPNGKNKLIWIEKDRAAINKEVNQFRIEVEKFGDLIYEPNQAKKIYDLTIKPFEKELNLFNIKTLVFVNDGIFRSVPMAALHDGKGFLVDRYMIANIPSLSSLNKFAVKQNKFQVLSAGLTESAEINGESYQPLKHVRREIDEISSILPRSKKLLNENFTYTALQSELQQKSYPIIHIATHAEFSNVLDDTFLVMGNNEKLTISDFDKLINDFISRKKTVTLLALTACETAAGDETAALGLAGVAVDAGVKSTLASLWTINDGVTVDLIVRFYKEWYQNKVSKAEALRRAQQQVISQGGKNSHPYYWASFVLIGNWL